MGMFDPKKRKIAYSGDRNYSCSCDVVPTVLSLDSVRRKR